MAEIAVTAVITVLCEKLITGDLMKLARSKGIDSQLNKWKNTLPMIQAVLGDASQKHITDGAIQLWVTNLQDLAYDIEDVLDDLATEALRRKLNQEAHASTSTSTGKVLKFVPTCCTNFTPRNIMYDRKMSSRLDEITTKLDDLIVLKNSLGLKVNVERSNMIARRLEENSLVDESQIMGREGDKDALLGKLLGDEESDQKVSIVSIVGMGGIGKTTLAKLLYNEEKVKDHFELRAWVCVSEEFDVFNISNAIFEALGGDNKRFSNLDPLHVALKEKLSKKRFLLVLDDVWNEEHSKWELLQSPLLVGEPGSRVIVTTRSTSVASVMDSVEVYGLEVLSKEDAMSLFAQYALGEKNFDKHPTLKLLGEGIVKKCGRLPLALKTLGRVLMGNRNGDEWEELLKSEIWDIEDGNKILPALRLSYYHLPPHLKQLFAYCSLIPKDYVFDKNTLVLLWVAEGFLSQSKGNKSMERLGHQYFDELESRSFFQYSVDDELGYTMHDLINDLASSVAGEFSFRLDDEVDVSDMNETFDKFRHFSLIAPRSGSYRKLKELQRAKHLRTFLLMSTYRVDLWDKVLAELLPELRFLRVLSAMGFNPNQDPRSWSVFLSITKVPESIGSLKHLRYLNFSYTKITCLSEQVSDLYNLQTLLLHHCTKLSSLPKSFTKLINLRHLDVSNTPNLEKMPLGIGGLMSLQTLTKVIVEGANGFKISDLKGLPDLQGRLSILGLDKVINQIQAQDANLHQKKGLEDLEMKWSDASDVSHNEMIDYEVLKELRPHPKLKKLKILNNKGTRFPSWVGDPSFDELTKLTLCGCRSTHLRLGHLRSLKHLYIEKCDELRYLWEQESEACKSLVSLQSLEVFDCKNLVSLAEKEDNFGISMESLKQVNFVNCDSLESYDCPNSVQSLCISGCDSMTSLALSAVQEHPSPLTESIVSDCDNIQLQPKAKPIPVKHFRSLPMSRLTSLEIRYCNNLKSFPHEHLQSLTSLEEMWIYNCPSMDYSFPCGVWPPNLRKLRIGGLNKPMSEWGLQNFPTSLVELILFGRDSGVVSFAVADDVRNTSTTPSSSSSSFLLPPSLVSLRLYDFTDVESFSEVLPHLPCLKRLDISSCPKITDLKTTSGPSNLIIEIYK